MKLRYLTAAIGSIPMSILASIVVAPVLLMVLFIEGTMSLFEKQPEV